MYFSYRSRLRILLGSVTIATIVGGLLAISMWQGQAFRAHAASTPTHMAINCAFGAVTCTEVFNSEAVFGHYVGHDEPSNLFYSNKPGSGNQMRYTLVLPKDPTPSNPLAPGKSFNFQLHPAFWFGMAMCATQSFPEQVSTCTPDSDKNIVDPSISPNHPGTAFTELQFYPPGWVPWPADSGPGTGGTSCAATKWCVALNIDSLAADPVNGTAQNPTCVSQIGSTEYLNFAFVTKKGVPQPNSPPNPVQSTLTTFTPNPSADLFMNSGDTVAVTLHDTAHGLQVIIDDKTTGQSGSMTASAANGFGQVKYDPTGTSCINQPYDFHPMYSTSSEKTRVIWAAHTYNVAFADEIGHFDYCNGSTPIPSSLHGAPCPAGSTEGLNAETENIDVDDTNCFPAAQSTLVRVPGCTQTNIGFDGTPYQPVWPDGNTRLHPTSLLFTSPLTGSGYNINYSRTAFEADLPAIENQSAAGNCNVFTGIGCGLIPSTDDCSTANPGVCVPATFYPFFSIRTIGGTCYWQLGNHIPGSANDFHQNQEYGTLLPESFITQGGGSINAFQNFRQILSNNLCQA